LAGFPQSLITRHQSGLPLPLHSSAAGLTKRLKGDSVAEKDRITVEILEDGECDVFIEGSNAKALSVYGGDLSEDESNLHLRLLPFDSIILNLAEARAAEFGERCLDDD